MIKLTTITILAITIPICAHAATAINLNDGELCLNSAQCKSTICKLLSTSNNIAVCVPKAKEGEICTAKTIYGIYYFPVCERGLTCTTPESSSTEYGYCVDEAADCPTCNAWIRVGPSSYSGYVEYLHGVCGSACGDTNAGWETAYRCAINYYGISHSDVITTPTGCKKCPENGACYEGLNETFHCLQGYYKSGNECLKCPLVGTDADGKDTYGYTEYNLFEDDITRCKVNAGTYTDETGTFELSDTCSYME